mmetsp:Transcript_17105/g.47737  ORF Transcript_17105/g.47737 Transcript_17105/m.47737 type:complete len:881 (+) Transcript_17105:198-2840(+)
MGAKNSRKLRQPVPGANEPESWPHGLRVLRTVGEICDLVREVCVKFKLKEAHEFQTRATQIKELVDEWEERDFDFLHGTQVTKMASALQIFEAQLQRIYNKLKVLKAKKFMISKRRLAGKIQRTLMKVNHEYIIFQQALEALLEEGASLSPAQQPTYEDLSEDQDQAEFAPDDEDEEEEYSDERTPQGTDPKQYTWSSGSSAASSRGRPGGGRGSGRHGRPPSASSPSQRGSTVPGPRVPSKATLRSSMGITSVPSTESHLGSDPQFEDDRNGLSSPSQYRMPPQDSLSGDEASVYDPSSGPDLSPIAGGSTPSSFPSDLHLLALPHLRSQTPPSISASSLRQPSPSSAPPPPLSHGSWEPVSLPLGIPMSPGREGAGPAVPRALPQPAQPSLEEIRLREVVALADEGDPQAAFEMGMLCREGQVVEYEPVAALEYLRIAAEDGSAEAAYLVGCMVGAGEGLAAPDLQEAAAWYRKAACSGHVEASVAFGQALELGTGAAQNQRAAAAWYKKAALAGSSRGANNLGKLFFDGRGVTQDTAKAVAWFRYAGKCSGPQCAAALNNLGICYEDGLGVEADQEAARGCYQAAADLGHLGALVNLAYLQFDMGDIPAARMSFELAASRGHAEAIYCLACIVERQAIVSLEGGALRSQHEDEDVRGSKSAMGSPNVTQPLGDASSRALQAYNNAGLLYQRAAEAGDPRAQHRLAAWYWDEGYVDEALALFHVAAAQQHAPSLNALGIIAEEGQEGCEQDLQAAWECYRQAALFGSAEAAANLRAVEEVLEHSELESALRRDGFRLLPAGLGDVDEGNYAEPRERAAARAGASPQGKQSRAQRSPTPSPGNKSLQPAGTSGQARGSQAAGMTLPVRLDLAGILAANR